MFLKTPVLILSVCAIALASCGGSGQGNGGRQKSAHSNTTTGAVTGAILGGAIGAATNDNSATTGLIAGAAIGAVAGGLVGSALDQQANDLRSSLSNQNISVTNKGDYLVVNLPQDLLFAVDSAALQPSMTADLNAVASNLLKYPNSKVEVIGHTDNTGTAAYNQDLSQRRAVSVTNVLLSGGVPASRVAAFGRGEDQPIATNLSEEGRAQNRRVEIIVRPNR